MSLDITRQTPPPRHLAKLLDITERELAAALRVHPNILRLRPENALLQNRLRVLAEVFAQVLELRSDPLAAAFHMKNTPIRVLRHQTLLEAVSSGEASKALRYLQTISAGQNA